MTVLHFIPSLKSTTGGPPRSLSRMIAGLAGLGLRNILVSLDRGGLLLPEDKGVTTILLGSWALPFTGARWPLGLKRRMREICRWEDVEVIHDHGIWTPANYLACMAAQETGIPLVISPRGMLEPWALEFRYLKKRIAWWVYQGRALRIARAFHATSRQEAENIRTLSLPQPIAVIPHGVRIPDPPVRVPEKRKMVLFLSRIHPKKGLPMLIEAWARLKPKGWELVIAGPEEVSHLREIKDLARKLGIEQTCEFRGEVGEDAKWDLYRSARFFVLPSHSENFGMVVAEALACGVPVITTKGTPWEEVAGRRTGWWITPSVDGLFHALREALEMSLEESLEMGARGKALVEEKYSWDAVASAMIAFYHWVRSGGARPDFVIP